MKIFTFVCAACGHAREFHTVEARREFGKAHAGMGGADGFPSHDGWDAKELAAARYHNTYTVPAAVKA